MSHNFLFNVDPMAVRVVAGLILLGLVYFAVVVLIYTGMCGLAGRPIFLVGRGGPGYTWTGTGARIMGAILLFVGVVLAMSITMVAVSTWRGDT